MGFHNFGMNAIRMRRSDGATVDQRCEERLSDVVDSALIHFRGHQYRVPVVNISSRGTMIESDIVPRLGESVLVEFDSCSRIHAFVRWNRDGKIGLNFGHEIVLGG